MTRKVKVIIAAVLYAQVAFFSGAYRVNNVADNNPFRGIADVYAAVFWPIYWNAVLMLRVTE